MGIVLELKNVSKYYGDLAAADNINIEVGQTEFFSLLGPSGSGKTTMLRIIAGLERRYKWRGDRRWMWWKAFQLTGNNTRYSIVLLYRTIGWRESQLGFRI